jgi:hypothetical protein
MSLIVHILCGIISRYNFRSSLYDSQLVLLGFPNITWFVVMLPGNFYLSATQPLAWCHTPWLRWFVPVENKIFMSLLDLKCKFGGRGISQMTTGSATPANHVVATRENRMKGSPLGVASHPSFPFLHIGWLNCFRVSGPKAYSTLLVL